MTTATDRVRIPVYIIERDNGDGRLNRRYSLNPLGGSIQRALEPGTNLVAYDDLDGGLAGYLTAPAGTTAGLTKDDDEAVWLPGEQFGLDLDEAVEDARCPGPSEYGFGWSPAKDEDKWLHAE